MTTPLKARRKVVLFKSEAAYGTDPVPTAAANAILVRNFQFRPLTLQYDDREYDVPYFGNKGRVIGGQYGECSFECELAGSGEAGTAPGYGALLKACGMSETVVADTSVTYAPLTTSEVSGTLYFYLDGRLQKLQGVFGNAEVRIQRGRIPVIAFSLMGLHVQPTDVALVTPTLTGFVKPIAVNKTNTPTLTLDTVAVAASEVMLTTGNVLVYRNLPNSEAIRFVDRKSSGSVTFERGLIATKDWETIIKSEATKALSVVHGTVAGNIATLGAAQAQLTDPESSEEDNLSMFKMRMELQPSSSGNDEWSLALT